MSLGVQSVLTSPPSNHLPPLRERIRRSFYAVISVYALLGIFMMGSVFLASGITPKVIHINYDSIHNATLMREAWNSLRFPEIESNDKSWSKHWIIQFEEAIGAQENNVNEPKEDQVVREIRAIWDASKLDPSKIQRATFSKLNDKLKELIEINEKGMFRLAEESTNLGRKVFIASIAFFIISLIFVTLLSDGLANRLALPIKDIAEALRNNTNLERKLRLPMANSLEMRILIRELSELWDRLTQYQKLNIEETTAQKERLQTILSSVEDAVLVLDQKGIVTQVNSGMLEILELEPHLVIGHFWNDLSTASLNYLKLRDLFESNLQQNNSMEIKTGENTKIFAARSRLIQNTDKNTVGIIHLLHDITETRQKDRIKGEFIEVLSHELKTPLESLQTAATYLTNRKNELKDDLRLIAQTIYEDSSRIKAISNDFSQVGLADFHSLKLDLEKQPLSELIPNWIKPFIVLANDKDIKIEFIKEGSEVIWANVDCNKLPWAFSNLLENAIRVSQRGSQITVYMTDRSRYAEIEIQDEGPGISPDTQRHLFEPHFQSPTVTQGVSRGFLGMGLTIAKEIIKAHHGQIEHFNRKPHGSIFRVSLPYIVVI